MDLDALMADLCSIEQELSTISKPNSTSRGQNKGQRAPGGRSASTKHTGTSGGGSSGGSKLHHLLNIDIIRRHVRLCVVHSVLMSGPDVQHKGGMPYGVKQEDVTLLLVVEEAGGGSNMFFLFTKDKTNTCRVIIQRKKGGGGQLAPSCTHERWLYDLPRKGVVKYSPKSKMSFCFLPFRLLISTKVTSY